MSDLIDTFMTTIERALPNSCPISSVETFTTLQCRECVVKSPSVHNYTPPGLTSWSVRAEKTKK